MKRILTVIILSFGLVSPVLLLPACSTPPSARVTQVRTLKVIGASVDSTMKLAARLYVDGEITREQWDKIALIHDKYQVVYNAAVMAVQANLDSLASPELIDIANQLANLIPHS
jgi:hypothetical protein